MLLGDYRMINTSKWLVNNLIVLFDPVGIKWPGSVIFPFGLSTVLCLFLTTILLSSCAEVNIVDSGYGKLVDYQCIPVAGKTIRVANTIPGGYLSSGDTDIDMNITRKDGTFEFDIGGNVSYLSMSLSSGDEGRPKLLRNLARKHLSNMQTDELAAIRHTSKESPLLVYIDENENVAPYDYSKAVFSFGGQFKEKLSAVIVAGIAHMRIGIKDQRNTILLSAINDGDISEITGVTSQGITIAGTRKLVTIENFQSVPMRQFYIRSGNKEYASIITFRFLYNPVNNSIFIKHYKQNVSLVKEDINHFIKVNLDECGGQMDRGMLGFYSRISEEQKQKFFDSGKPHIQEQQLEKSPYSTEAKARMLNERRAQKIAQTILAEINYIDNKSNLVALFNRSDIDQSVLVKLLEYDFITKELFGDVYRHALDKNWSIAIHAIGKDPRISEADLIDIINRLDPADRGTPFYLGKYVRSPSAGAAVMSTAIRIFKKTQASGNERAVESFAETIFQSSLHNRKLHEAYVAQPDDLRTIQAFLEKRFAAITDENKKSSFAFETRWVPYASSELLEEAYFTLKQKGTYKHELLQLVDHPYAPKTVLSDIASYLLNINDSNAGNVRSMNKLVASIIDHPNVSQVTRDKLYALLDANIASHLKNAYIAPGIAMAKTNPDAIYERFVAEAINKPGRSNFQTLLSNPSLPLVLSEQLVDKFGCPQKGINDLYAKKYFQKVPDPSCYYAALHSKVTSASTRKHILKSLKIHKKSELLRSENLPHDRMRTLYCAHRPYTQKNLAHNPYLPEDIIVDMFNNSQNQKIIDAIAANPATPTWMLEKIYRNDYSARTADPNPAATMMCNPLLPGNLRKYQMYRNYHLCTATDHKPVTATSNNPDNASTQPVDCDIQLARVIPEVRIVDSGIVTFKYSKDALIYKEWTGKDLKDGVYEVTKSTTTIPAEQGIEFGVFFELNTERTDEDVDIDFVTIFPDGGLIDPSTGIAQKSDSDILQVRQNTTQKYTFKLDHEWEVVPGQWVFQLKYRNKLLAEQAFTLYRKVGLDKPPPI